MFPRSWVQGVTADLKHDRQRVSKIQFALGLRLTIDDIENGGIADTIHSDGVCLQKGRQVLDLDVILAVFQLHHCLPFDLQYSKVSNHKVDVSQSKQRLPPLGWTGKQSLNQYHFRWRRTEQRW